MQKLLFLITFFSYCVGMSKFLTFMFADVDAFDAEERQKVSQTN